MMKYIYQDLKGLLESGFRLDKTTIFVLKTLRPSLKKIEKLLFFNQYNNLCNSRLNLIIVLY